MEQSQTDTRQSLSKRHGDSSSVRADIAGPQICQIIGPVGLCSLYVVLLVRLLEWSVAAPESLADRIWSQLGLPHAPQDSNTSLLLVNNAILVLAFLLVLVLVTLLILLVFYLEWHRCLEYYFYIPSLIIMAILTPIYAKQISASLNWFGLDLISVALLVWNFTALGLVAIHGVYASAPLALQQCYLIHNSALLAVFIAHTLPGWAPWSLLGLLALWDLFAVLAPCGPLRLILGMAELAGVVEMPGLVYTTGPGGQAPPAKRILPEKEGDAATCRRETVESDTSQCGPRHNDPGVTGPRTAIGKPSSSGEKDTSTEERGLNIGLGDFVFYGLLVGLTARGRTGNYYATLATLNAVLMGLLVTLALLAATRRAVPALPIAVALGLVTAAFTMHLVPQLANQLASQQVFV